MHTRESRRRARGQSFVETAMSIVLLLLLTFSVVDAGLLFFAYLTLQNGVTEATRFAVTGHQNPDPNNPGNNLSREDTLMQLMRASTPGLKIDAADVSFYNVTRKTTGNIGGPDDVIQVTVRHQWQLLSPLLWPFVGNGGTLTLRASATMKNEPYTSS
jgi:Flp pilus assembly protein TadG